MKGCLRSFYVDQSSKEHTLQFSIKGWWISDYIAFYRGQEAVMSIQALTDSVVIECKCNWNLQSIQVQNYGSFTPTLKNIQNNFDTY